MARTSDTEQRGTTSLRGVIDEVFGRWPAWPWSVLALIVTGGIVGAMAAPALRAADVASHAALGRAACVGYGIVAAAFLSLIPIVWKLLMRERGVARRPAAADASWWPLKLLAAALQATPTLRRTQQEFTAAVEAAGGQARSILGHRLWPACVVAFVAPVLGLITAWQSGAKVQLLLQPGDEVAKVFPAFIAQVSPPMVATIAASLALMVAIVAIDQWTKSLLQRWCGIVEAADGNNPIVVDRLGREDFLTVVEPRQSPTSPIPEPTREKLPTHPLDPDELDRQWRQSNSRSE